MRDKKTNQAIRSSLIECGEDVALNPLKEAANTYNAWAILDDAIEGDEHDSFSKEYIEGEREMLADSIADCIQACRDLVNCYGINLNSVHVNPMYDTLGNERHKAVCELRKLNTDTGGFVKALASALDVEWQAPRVTQTLAEIRDRLIYLIGGNQTTLIDLYGIWGDESNLPKTADFVKPSTESDEQSAKDGESRQMGQDDGTYPNDVPLASITDELREWAVTQVPVVFDDIEVEE